MKGWNYSQLIGQFLPAINNVLFPLPRAHQSQVLLAYLLLNPKGYTQRTHLLTMLELEHDYGDQARRVFSQALWRLRTALPEKTWLYADRDKLGWHQHITITTDFSLLAGKLEAASKQTLLSQETIRQLQAHLDNTSGTLLSGYELPWINQERLNLTRLRFRTLDLLLSAYKQRGDLTSATACAERLVDLNWKPETAYTSLIQLLLLQGNAARAATFFEQALAGQSTHKSLRFSPEFYRLETKIAHARPAQVSSIELLNERFDNAPLVGYDKELKQIANLLGRQFSELDKGGQAVLLENNFSVDISKLIAACVQEARWRNMTVINGTWRHDKQSEPYFAFRDAMETMFTPLEARQMALTVEPEVLARFAAVAPNIRSMLAQRGGPVESLPSNSADWLDMWHAITEALTQWSSVVPTVIILRNLHFADPDSFNFLTYLAERLPQTRCLLILTCNVGLVQASPDRMRQTAQLKSSSHVDTLHVDKLRPKALHKLLSFLFDSPTLPTPLVTTLIDNANGSALTLMTFLRAMLDRRLIIRDSISGWKLSDRYTQTEFKSLVAHPSITNLFTDQLTSLSTEQRELAQAMALMDADLSLDVVNAISGVTPARLITLLQALIGWDVLTATATEYRFTSEALRQTLLNGFSGAKRQSLHHRFAALLLREPMPNWVQIAHQFQLAGLPLDAIKNLQKAAQQATKDLQLTQAITHHEQIIQLCDASELTADQKQQAEIIRLEAYCALIPLLIEQHDFQRATKFAARIQATSWWSASHPIARTVQLASAIYASRVAGDYEQAARIAVSVAERANQAGAIPDQLNALDVAIEALINAGSYQRAADLLAQREVVMPQHRPKHDALIDARWYLLNQSILLSVSQVAKRLDNLTDARTLLAIEHDHLIAQSLLGSDQFELSNEVLTKIWRFGEINQLHWRHCKTQLLQARLHVLQADYGRAIALFRAVVQRTLANGDHQLLCAASDGLGECLSRIGVFREAYQVVNRAWELSKQHKLIYWQSRLLLRRMDLCLAQPTAKNLSQFAVHDAHLTKLLADKPRPGLVAQQLHLRAWRQFYRQEWREAQLLFRASAENQTGLQTELAQLNVLGLASAEIELGNPQTALGYISRVLHGDEWRSCSGRTTLIAQSLAYLSHLHLGEHATAVEMLSTVQRTLYTQQATIDQPEWQRRFVEWVALNANLEREIRRAGLTPSEGHVLIKMPLTSAPRGRPLLAHEYQLAKVTVHDASDQAIKRKAPRRRHKIVRILREAHAQGMSPTYAILAELCGVGLRTIERDMLIIRQENPSVPDSRGNWVFSR